MYKNNLLLVLIMAITMLNLLLFYVFLWNPYNLFFNKPEYSFISFQKREILAISTTILNFLVLGYLNILLILKYIRTKKLFILAPTASILTIILLIYLNSLYPNSQYEYLKNEHQYLEQTWLNNDNDNRVFKRYRSEKPFASYSSHEEIVWQIDSLKE